MSDISDRGTSTSPSIAVDQRLKNAAAVALGMDDYVTNEIRIGQR